MIRSFMLISAPVMLTACSSGAGSSASDDAPSCKDVVSEHLAFKRGAWRQAQQFNAELEREQSGNALEGYPKLKNSQKFLKFQADLEAEDNRYKVRIRECVK